MALTNAPVPTASSSSTTNRVLGPSDALPESAVSAGSAAFATFGSGVVFHIPRTDDDSRHVVKRVFDVIAVLILIVFAAPLMGVAALAVRLTSRGPVLFRQQRVGARRTWRDGVAVWETTSFKMLKFRSMKLATDDLVHRTFTQAFIRGDENTMATFGAGNGNYKLQRDPRITPVGAFLRRTSIDELPQLFNVLLGDMSLVGPRPALDYEVANYKPWHVARFQAVPGITGLWQIGGRSTVTFDDMVRLDIEYARDASLWLDLRILVRTIGVLWARRGVT